MEYFSQEQHPEAKRWMQAAAAVAQQALCQRDKCGAVIVKDGAIVGSGYNAPPNDDLSHARCHDVFVPNSKPKSDRTCCMHAEWRAILDALRRHPEPVEGSVIFFTRVDGAGNILYSGKPYCTVCSRFVLDVGIAAFVLWHEDGIRSYSAAQYNDLSHSFEKE